MSGCALSACSIAGADKATQSAEAGLARGAGLDRSASTTAVRLSCQGGNVIPKRLAKRSQFNRESGGRRAGVGQSAVVIARRSGAARPCRDAALNVAAAKPCHVVDPLPATCRTPLSSGRQCVFNCRATSSNAPARSIAAVGQPCWSQTTLSFELRSPAASMVRIKFLPVEA